MGFDFGIKRLRLCEVWRCQIWRWFASMLSGKLLKQLNDALGSKSCQKVVRMHLQICGFRMYAILCGGCVLICVPWRSGFRCSAFSCRVALARIVPVLRMGRVAYRWISARVPQAWPKDCALAVSSILIRIRRFELILCTILGALWLRVRQRLDARASLHDLADFHGSSIRKISFCQFAPNDRRSLSRFRNCNDTNRVSCSNDPYPHRLCESADKQSFSKQLCLVGRLLIAQLLVAVRDPSIEIRSIGKRWRFIVFVKRVIFRFFV